ncbi:hypothetical protein ACJJTC_004517 [Scirpophaga incertulas]
MFAGSVILQHEKSAFQAVINNWCGTGKQSWRLMYRASTHGYSAHAFHSHCDGVSPVLLLVQVSRGGVVGGYCEAAWGASGYAAAERGFLFSLAPPANDPQAAPTAPTAPTASQPVIYPLQKKSFALCSHPDFGPIFGAGADLLISSHCNTNSDSYSNLHSYGDSGSPQLTPHYNFTVRDYELYTVHN